MYYTALPQALTLYESGTLTLEQAATRAGRTEAAFAAAARRHGIVAPSDPNADAERSVADGEAETELPSDAD